jgi:hypothetical protein
MAIRGLLLNHADLPLQALYFPFQRFQFRMFRLPNSASLFQIGLFLN